MASVKCNSEQPTSTDISSERDMPHVKSNLGFTVYYEMSDDTPNKMTEAIVIDKDSNERLDFLEECLRNRKLDFNKDEIAVNLLKEAEMIFEHGGDSISITEPGGTNPESSEESCQSICQFFLRGKCRFGEKCFNLHEKSSNENTLEDDHTDALPLESKTEKVKSKSPKHTIVETEKQRKKPPMKTATDVINRIQWDEKLKPERFTVGYLDRFLGVVENMFNSFDWEDVTSVDPTILAIPRHRIQYFKYDDEIVWDKNKRLDCVFGSTGSELTIVDIIDKRETVNETENHPQNVDA